MLQNIDLYSLWSSVKIYILLFFTYSFLGWFMESIGGILNVKKFVNRGFLIGPYCPVYGIGVVIITLLLGQYSNDLIVLFLLSTLIAGILEYGTSYFMEKLFNARWWDYHNRKFNINGRICLETLVPFGIAATVILKIINPFIINNLFLKINENVLDIVTVVFLILFFIDFIISFKIISSFKDATYVNEDNTEEITHKVKDKAEDIIMKAESEAIILGRNLKVRKIKFNRKMKYTGKKVSIIIKNSPKRIIETRYLLNKKVELEKEKINNKVKFAKDNVEFKTKQSIEKIDNTIKSIKINSEEFTNMVKEKFAKKSILKNRLIKAFPNMQIKRIINNKRKSSKKK